MKLTTKREDLVSKLSIVSRAVSTRAATQALSGVLAQRRGRTRRPSPPPISTWASKPRSTPRSPARARSCYPAGCSPRSPARWPTRPSRSRPREAEHDVEIRSGSSSFHLRVLPAEDFPKLPEPERGVRPEDPGRGAGRRASTSSPAPLPATTCGRCSPASSSPRPAREMTMVATDSYRLAVKRTELESDLGGEIEANIPARALRELARILTSEGVEEVDDLAALQPGGVRGRARSPSPRG